MKYIHILLLPVLLSVASGCAFTPIRPTTPIDDTRIYRAPQKQVWQALVQSLTAKNFPIRVSDATGGLITTDKITTKDDLINYKPRYSLGTEVGIMKERLSVSALVTHKDGKTKLKLTVQVEASQTGGARTSWQSVFSNGKMESEILSALEKNFGLKPEVP